MKTILWKLNSFVQWLMGLPSFFYNEFKNQPLWDSFKQEESEELGRKEFKGSKYVAIEYAPQSIFLKKGRYQEIYKCKNCGSCGHSYDIGHNYKPCATCGKYELTETVGKWNGKEWEFAE